MYKLTDIINQIANHIIKEDDEENEYELQQQLNAAKKRVGAGHINFFNQITDKDLIDFAIYRMEAAERRYMYLLKQKRLYEKK